MEPEKTTLPPAVPATANAKPLLTPSPAEPAPPAEPHRGLRWIFIGSQGLRAGWSVVVFFLIFAAINIGIDTALFHFHLIDKADEFSPHTAFFSEVGGLLALLVAVAVVGLIEGRRILDYNLTGSRRPQHFLFGLAAGFLALSTLVGALVAGGWLHFGAVALSGSAIFRFALLWGCVFLMVGCVEEGMFRCYGLFTLTCGINFWWALGIVAVACARLAIFVGGTASWGVYLAALLGVVPCYILHRRAASGGFWCAAWVTSTLFGYIHVGNPGEAWIGIFAAAFIGFVFCVSVRVTGSAWWAIGCHAGWDWGETFFYGTADSGLTPHGCYLTSTPAGNPLWSGGSVGPEGSLLVLGAVLFLLALVLAYGRWGARTAAAA
ncbi:MAG: CPBP family intramembrane glutamic endopeptidase [Terracidiphilus sp.]|jgi:membrane protease YdiL (CAAX protease family)